VVALLGCAAAVVPFTPVDVPGWVGLAGAVTVTTTYACGLAARTGGRPLIAAGLVLLLSVVAVSFELPLLVAAAAVTTAVLAGVLGVMATVPAPGLPAVVRECLVAVATGAVGAFAVAGYGAQVSMARFGYLTLALTLLAAIGLVYRLGAGMHGLGRRGYAMVVAGLVLLSATLAYTEALSHWGSPALVATMDGAGSAVADTLGAVPRPIEMLVGIPALAWGVSTRARRRQGWWVCAFGSVGVVSIASSLLSPGSPTDAGLSLLYSTLGGLVLGFLVIRADQLLTGTRGRRARRLEEAAAHRPEPGRMQPLL